MKEQTNNRIKHLKVWIDRRTGIEYARFRRRGLPEQQLPTPVGSDAFWIAYRQALAGELVQRAGSTIGASVRSPAGSFSAAMAAYLVVGRLERARARNPRAAPRNFGADQGQVPAPTRSAASAGSMAGLSAPCSMPNRPATRGSTVAMLCGIS